MTIFTNLFLESRILWKVRFIFILFIPFIFGISDIKAQTAVFEFDSTHQALYHEIVQLKIISAKKEILELKKLNSNNLATIFIEDLSDFFSVVTLSSVDAFEYYKTKNTERIDLFEKTNVNSPFIKFALAEFYLHRAISRLFFDEKFKAVFDLKSARSYINKNIEEFPKFTLNYKTKSLLNVILGSIPPSFKWASSLISLNGDYKTGLNELNKVINFTYLNEDYTCFFPEILTYKVLIAEFSSTTSEVDRKSIQTFFSTLTVKNELVKNHILLYTWCDYLIKNEQNELAITLLKSKQTNSNYLPFYPLEFILGVALQNKLDDECEIHFTNYINLVKSGNYVNASYQRLAWQKLLENNNSEYQRLLKKITSKHKTTEQDQAAYTEYLSSFAPNVGLLKASLLFDGGYYSKSQLELEKINPETLPNNLFKLEYYYRLARINEKNSNFLRAIYLFNKVIIDGTSIPNYFAANAALNAGNICEKQKDFNRAKFYYKKCLTLSPNQYKESIHQKAKIGLERIK
jgi:hypothetical protein